MSVIAWDGKTLAADMQATNGTACTRAHKLRKLDDGTVVGWTGRQDTGLAMVRWYIEGADPKNLPAGQNKDDWSRLIVLKPTGEIVEYEQYGEPQEVLDVPAAWGAGQDFALGALAMGADARRAVEITNELCCACGLGVDAFDVIPVAERGSEIKFSHWLYSAK